jgi:hypothetical protein
MLRDRPVIVDAGVYVPGIDGFFDTASYAVENFGTISGVYGIAQEAVGTVTYFHVDASHAVVLAEGFPRESYLDTASRGAFTSAFQRRARSRDQKEAAAGANGTSPPSSTVTTGVSYPLFCTT